MSGKVNSNTCSYCGQNFLLKSNLRTHELKHKAEVKSEKKVESNKREREESIAENCDIERGILDLKTTLSDLPEVVDVENKTVALRNGETLKGGIQHGRKAYECEVCGKQYNLKSCLKTHMVNHTSKKSRNRHYCVMCDKKIVLYENFKQHMARHAITESLKCTFCKKGFPSQKAYDKHVRYGQLLANCVAIKQDNNHSKDKLETHHNEESVEKTDFKITVQSCPSLLEAEGILKCKEWHCNVCSEVFHEKSAFKEHKLRHKEELLCLKCDRKFQNVATLRSHMKIHLGKAQMQCEVCGRMYSIKGYKAHLRTHTGERPYECKVCGLTFIQNHHLTTHMKIHTLRKDHHCVSCDRGFYTRESFQRHLRVHMRPQEKRYKCRICLEVGFKLSELHQHKKEMHAEELRPHHTIHTVKAELYTCEVCQETFTYSAKLYLHYIEHTQDELSIIDRRLQDEISAKKNRSVICEICGKLFLTRIKLKVHMRIHTGEKPYECSYCKKTFRAANSLSVHERIHTGERPFKCSECNKSFIQHAHAKAHVVLHSKEKPFSCKHCGKSFATKNYLYNHSKIHVKSEQCENNNSKICLKSEQCENNHSKIHVRSEQFENNNSKIPVKSEQCENNLSKIHEKSEQCEKIFECQHCGEVFSINEQRDLHQISCSYAYECGSSQMDFNIDNVEILQSHVLSTNVIEEESIVLYDGLTDSESFEAPMILRIGGI